MQNHFVKNPDEYQRDLNIIQHYVHDAALYLHKRSGKPIEQCRQFVINKTKTGGDMGIVDPDVLCLTREDEVRKQEVIPFSSYLSDIIQNDRIIAPTLTVYLNQSQKQSILSDFIDGNIQKRKVIKKEMFDAQEAKDEFLRSYKFNEQTSVKVSNNSLSGAHASQGTILHNKSSHSSLTSTCRTATSYGNANNEKFLMGNRHYWSADIVKNNIISIIGHVDFDLIQKAVDVHGIRPPTVDETMDLISYSTSLYGLTDVQLIDIRKLVETLTDLERIAFAYVGDLYHLAKFNDTLVREMIGELSTKSTEYVEDPKAHIKAMNGDMFAYVSLLCTDELAGTSVDKLEKEDFEKYRVIGATAKHVMEVQDKYQLIIKAFWVTDCLPASVANIRSSVRRAVVTSDTDSTIFTTQYWTEWFVGKLDFSEKSKNVSYAITYLATQTIIHILATISAGFGVHQKHLHTLAMKNEYAFPTFSLTAMAKHYYAYISAQEGKVFDEYEMEVKGVQLKDSNVPGHIMDGFDETLKYVMDKVIAGEKISIVEMNRRVASIEVSIIESIRKGSSDYLKNAQVKDKESYVNPKSSPYAHYLMWEEVFAPKYGEAPPPPYQATRVSVDLNNKTKINNWLDGLEDRELAERMSKWLKDNFKTSITSLLLPRPIVSADGIPDEVIRAMDVRKLIYTTIRPYYLLLESLGIYMINDNLTKLVSDDPLYLPDGYTMPKFK